MLQERGVGPFDKYEAWLPKLLGDRRFKAVPLPDRKRLFSQEQKQLGQHQREELVAARRQRCGDFAALLAGAEATALLAAAASADEWLRALADSGLGADERWEPVPPDDREKMVRMAFEAHQRRSSEAAALACQAFQALLEEAVLGAGGGVAEPPPFGEVRRLLRAEPRWKAVGCAEKRQSLYAAAAADAARRWLRKRRQEAQDRRT
ncbi:unnamed protein product [Prorocentrum cordatum]|uniref:Uncharacterized protein n=1 Tax=Prorocentrum cordatum TaxID=2364126 RepID=A0ABN9UD90_9DINO|nr:unnamed protein product [Polarella glacialis]